MQFTKEEIETAVKVLSYSKQVDKWVKGEMKAFGLDMKSYKGRKFYDTQRVEAARRLIK
jgi:hypothetical protein